ncbi:hypothetical protein P154DRAFT_619353 [Amniculicola lignicola CBS 123094]|uniref:Uncharacterized protein n=1 Tax=Amniculicola lignicola CBS 123094 TaxID=1392246 RepID=A0A6A5WMD2_9PLEO|nr:hypothetical protein P154DRAFT_619353 [Amniculicola lignicola CBS 123094]
MGRGEQSHASSTCPPKPPALAHWASIFAVPVLPVLPVPVLLPVPRAGWAMGTALPLSRLPGRGVLHGHTAIHSGQLKQHPLPNKPFCSGAVIASSSTSSIAGRECDARDVASHGTRAEVCVPSRAGRSQLWPIPAAMRTGKPHLWAPAGQPPHAVDRLQRYSSPNINLMSARRLRRQTAKPPNLLFA